MKKYRSTSSGMENEVNALKNLSAKVLLISDGGSNCAASLLSKSAIISLK